jgi:hypothetical protein
MKVEVERISGINSRSNLRAVADIRIGESKFRSWRVIQKPGQTAWVSPPVESWEDRSGKRHYRRLIEFPERLQQRIYEAILRAWEAEIGTKQ